jgi:hypothetical protein
VVALLASLGTMDARGADGAPAPALDPPITEVDHPRYVDARGTPVDWSDVRGLAAGSGALGDVRKRVVGRNLVRAMFAGATVLEAWGAAELAERDLWTQYLLGAQAGVTGLCAVVSFTSGIQGREEDRAIVLNEVNAMGRHR